MQQYVIDAGFDMDATAKYMEKYYLAKNELTIEESR